MHEALQEVSDAYLIWEFVILRCYCAAHSRSVFLCVIYWTEPWQSELLFPLATEINRKILLLGRANCGKTSIRSRIFSAQPARETRRLPPTIDVEHTRVRFFGRLSLSIWDCGGSERNRYAGFTLFVQARHLHGVVLPAAARVHVSGRQNDGLCL